MARQSAYTRLTRQSVNAEGNDQQGTHLSGRKSLLVRAGWLSVVVPAIVLFIVALPLRYTQLIHPAGVLRVSLEHMGLPLGFYAVGTLLLEILFVGTYCATAALLFWRKSSDWMALLVGFFLVVFGLNFPPPLQLLADRQPIVDLFVNLVAALTYICLDGLFFLFPNGRFVPRWTWLMLVVVTILEIPFNLPLSSPFSIWHWNSLLFIAIAVSEFVVPVLAQIYRYRRVSNAMQRQQTKWVVYGVCVALITAITVRALAGLLFPEIGQNSGFNNVASDPLLYTLMLLILLLIPLSFGFAILRSHLWDIDIIINRTLVYGALTASIVGIYMLVVVLLGQLLQANGNLFISLLATGFIAVLFQPLRERLQSLVNRLMYGERDTPYKVISRLGQRLEATLAPDTVLTTITETVAQALKLPYAAITLKQDEEFTVAASYGSLREELIRLPLIYQTELVGELVLASRAPGETFSSADHALLADLARQAGVATHAVRLTTDLQRLTSELQHSRAQLVNTREEERRRLRRDLHDGLGSVLASLNLRAGAIRTLLTRDPGAVDILVVEQQSTIRSAMADIRRLVYELRPPSLDELGLVGAMRERASQYSTRHGMPAERDGMDGLCVEVLAPESLATLPAAVEVAAYRITQEALANVAHHAHAHTCRISLEVKNGLFQMEITDDGIGLQEGYHAGVGLLSMRERAEELGGKFSIVPVPGGGTQIGVRLPLPTNQ
jgi:signal transduction histidine kinase